VKRSCVGDFIISPTVFVWLTGLCSSLAAGEVEFDVESLARFGTRTYKMTWIDRSSGSPVEYERGTMTFSANVDKEGISLKNLTRMYLPDGKRFIEYSTDCKCSRDERLEIRRIDAKVVRSDEAILHESETVVEKNRITHKFESRGKQDSDTDAWADGTILGLAVYYLVPQLSLRKGESVTLKSVLGSPTESLEKPKSHTITCLGIDADLTIDGQKLTKYLNVAKGEKSGITYWVDQKGLLRRVLINPENRLDLLIEKPQ